MTRNIIQSLCLSVTALLALAAASCSRSVTIGGETDAEALIYPDYKDVTVPCNIAPLDFHVMEPVGEVAVLVGCDGDTLCVRAADGDVTFPEKAWRRMLQSHKGCTLGVRVCVREEGVWRAYRPFGITVSADSIDPVLVYRRIPPLYGTWLEMGLYQRDLEGYKETALYENKVYHGNCANCHSLCARDPERFLFHLRTDGGGTYVSVDGERMRLDTKTDSTISNFTYPYWHPSGRFVAFSVNDIFQVFHTSDPNRIEVIDDASDVVVYDIERNEAFSSPLLRRQGVLETFPAFSPDGRTLYFCSAEKPDTLPELYKDVHYSLCAIPFDPQTRQFGTEVDTLWRADAHSSVSFPRPSPDGRWLVATVSPYGNFSIWHKEADLHILDLATGCWRSLDGANSADVDSYHSWSGNSRWMVLSSRRDDGLYTRPYFTHIDSLGRESKAFMLPQRHPRKFYCDLLDSYNIPEFASGPVDLCPRQVSSWIAQPMQQVGYR